MEQKPSREEEPRNRSLEIPLDSTVTLRLVTLEDAEKVYNLVTSNLEFLRPWVGWANDSFNRQFNEDFIRRNLNAYDAGTAYAMGIYDHDKLAGVVDIRNLDGQEDPEIGYWLAETAQGKGWQPALPTRCYGTRGNTMIFHMWCCIPW